MAGDQEGQRSLPTPFLTKTYQMVDDASVDEIISWNEDGTTFVVWRPAEFARDLLPKYFKHNNFSSFVRQLNTYGFRKMIPDRWEFANDSFRRGEKHLLCEIHRRKITTPAPAVLPPAPAAVVPVVVPVPAAISVSPANSGDLSSNSSPGPVPPPAAVGSYSTSSGGEMKEENDMLRKENARLTRELSQMKDLCGHIGGLISRFGKNEVGSSSSAPEISLLDLMPSGRFMNNSEEVEGRDNTDAVDCIQLEARAPTEVPGPGPSPMLFGVSIGSKRSRSEESEDSGSEVKREALEEAAAPQSPEQQPRQQQRWVVYCPRPTRPGSDGLDLMVNRNGSGSDRTREGQDGARAADESE